MILKCWEFAEYPRSLAYARSAAAFAEKFSALYPHEYAERLSVLFFNFGIARGAYEVSQETCKIWCNLAMGLVRLLPSQKKSFYESQMHKKFDSHFHDERVVPEGDPNFPKRQSM